jgi:hypothetical protein
LIEVEGEVVEVVEGLLEEEGEGEEGEVEEEASM